MLKQYGGIFVDPEQVAGLGPIIPCEGVTMERRGWRFGVILKCGQVIACELWMDTPGGGWAAGDDALNLQLQALRQQLATDSGGRRDKGTMLQRSPKDVNDTLPAPMLEVIIDGTRVLVPKGMTPMQALLRKRPKTLVRQGDGMDDDPDEYRDTTPEDFAGYRFFKETRGGEDVDEDVELGLNEPYHLWEPGTCYYTIPPQRQ